MPARHLPVFALPGVLRPPLMPDPFDLLDAPKALLLAVFRVLWWLAWDFWVETVGWTIGWCVLRGLTLGHFPGERLRDVDQASFGMALLTEAVGLCTLAAAIWALSGSWQS